MKNVGEPWLARSFASGNERQIRRTRSSGDERAIRSVRFILEAREPLGLVLRRERVDHVVYVAIHPALKV